MKSLLFISMISLASLCHSMNPFVTLLKRDPQFHQLARQIVETEVPGLGRPFKPEVSIKITGRDFHFSKIIKGEGRQQYKLAVMYAKNQTDLLMPRLLWKSRSCGGWRVAPEAITPSFGTIGRPHFSKGRGLHYTQETKLVEEIVLKLEEMENDPNYGLMLDGDSRNSLERRLCDFFDRLAPRGQGHKIASQTYSYEDEIDLYKMKSTELDVFTYYRAGRFRHSLATEQPEDIYNYFANLRYPKDFVPDFSQRPLRTYKFMHPMLGSINVEVYSASLEKKEIEWHMAYDSSGRVWVDRINFKNGQINSYGVYSEVIDTGLLTNKPIDHKKHARCIKNIKSLPKKDRIKQFRHDDEYFDLTPLLDFLMPIKEFRHAKNILRKPSLFSATDDGNFEEVRELLTQGADPYEKTECGETPLMIASELGNQDMILALAHFDLEIQDNKGQTAIFHAVKHNQLACTKLLLDLTANINTKTKDGKTILSFWLAAQPKMLKLLKENGASE